MFSGIKLEKKRVCIYWYQLQTKFSEKHLNICWISNPVTHLNSAFKINCTPAWHSSLKKKKQNPSRRWFLLLYRANMGMHNLEEHRKHTECRRKQSCMEALELKCWRIMAWWREAGWGSDCRVWLPLLLNLFSPSAGLRAPAGNHHGRTAGSPPWKRTTAAFDHLRFNTEDQKYFWSSFLKECDHLPQIWPISRNRPIPAI